MIRDLLGIVFIFFLITGVPILSYLTARDVRLRFLPRSAIYFSAVVSQWILAGLGVVVVLATFTHFGEVGFRAVSPVDFALWSAVVIAVALALTALILLLEYIGWWPDESPLVYLLIPSTAQEKLWAALAIAPTAALCEEFLYRGYLLMELEKVFRSMPWAWFVSSVAFGMAHAYQGFSGMARAAVLGALLAYPVVHLGSIYPAMAAHFVIDALALVWIGPTFLKRDDAS